MNTRNRMSRQRSNVLGLALMVMLSAVMMGCNEGYIGPDGAPLLYYLPPENLLEIVENPDPNIRLIDVRPSSAYCSGTYPRRRTIRPVTLQEGSVSCPWTSVTLSCARPDPARRPLS